MKPVCLLLALVAIVATASAQSIIPTLEADTISHPLGYSPQPFDVLHYDAELDLTRAPLPVVSGWVDVRVRWVPEVSGTRYFAFHLRGPVVTAAFLDGSPVEVTTQGDEASATYHHRIAVPPGMDPPDTSVIRIVYAGTMTDELGDGYWGGVGSGESGLYAMGVGFWNNYVSTTQHWLPCYDHPSDKATFRGRFKVLDPIVVAGNGTLSVTRRGDTAVYEWDEIWPAATYLLTFAAGPYETIDLGAVDGMLGPVPMVLYAHARDTAMTRRTFRLLPRMIQLYERRFGPYPYEKIGYVNTDIGAMEHQTMVSFPTVLSRRGDTVNVIGAHELAHQWFGDLVSSLDYRHAWLSESFATFGEALWAEERLGTTGYLNSLQSMQTRYTGSIARSEGIFPLYDFPRARPSSNYPETIYEKGGVVVGMLRYELGDSVFFLGLQEFLRRHKYGAATTSDLQDALEDVASRPLDWFFQQWVYSEGWPVLAVNTKREPLGDGVFTVTVDIEQTPAAGDVVFTNVPVELSFTGGTQPAHRMIRLNDRTQRFVLDSVPNFTTVMINRGPTVRALLTVDRNSAAPVQVDTGDIRIVVQPNPTDGSAALQVRVIGTVDCTELTYEIYDASGRRLGTGTREACEFSIPIDGLPSGALVFRFRLHDQFYDVAVAIAK